MVVLALAPSPALAQPQDQPQDQPEYRLAGEAILPHEALAGLVDSLHVHVQDNVTDGCWTNTTDVAERIEEILAAADIRTGDDLAAYGFSPLMPRLDLLVTGHRLEGACLASGQLALYFSNNTQLNFAHEDAIASVRTSQTNIMWMTTQAMASPDAINDVVLTWVDEQVTQLANQVATQREGEAVTQALATWGFSN